jgi:hypothetical protein
MPDITMCKGAGYEICDDCYRRTAKPSEFRQAYFTEPPLNLNEYGDCAYRWPTKPASDHRTNEQGENDGN